MKKNIEIIPASLLETREPFSSIFPIQDAVFQKILNSMKKNSFDAAHPIIVWKCDSAVIIDGHTRYRAAIECGISEIPIVFKEFLNAEEALDYAVSQQVNRRNLSSGEMLRYIAAADKLRQPGRPKKLAPNGANFPDAAPATGKGKSAEQIAKVLNISTRKAERLRKIAKDGTDEIKQALQNDEISINNAYEQTRKLGNVGASEDCENKPLTLEEQLQIAKKHRIKNIPEKFIATLEREVKHEKKHYPDIHYSEKELARIKAAILGEFDRILNDLA